MKTMRALNINIKPPYGTGFGLIELMISMTLSLFVILAITALFLGQKRSYTTQDDLSRLQENARFLMQTVTHDVRQAGYRDMASTGAFGVNLIIDGTQGVGATGVAASDSFTLRFFGSNTTNTGTPAADGAIVDCQGNSIGRDTMLVETFSIRAGANGEPALFCTIDAGATQVELFTGVESMQILYGEDSDDDGAVDRYRPANLITTMNLVRSVMISVLLRTPSVNNAQAASLIHNHFGTQYAPANVAPATDTGSVFTATNDGRIRKLFTFTVGLRNRLN